MRPSLRDSFLFPIATPEGRHDVLVGGLLLTTLLIGWILNLGHRLDVVRRLYYGERPYFRGFAPWGHTFRRGLRAFAAITLYLSPSVALGGAAWGAVAAGSTPAGGALAGLAALAFVLAIYALPGGMTYNAVFDDLSYLYRPDRALRRALEGGTAYLRAWGIGLLAIVLSLLGLLALGVGFFVTSVWAWSVVGYAFSHALVLPPQTPQPVDPTNPTAAGQSG